MIKKTLLLLLIVLLAPKAVTAQEIYAVLSSDEKTLTFYYDTKKDSRSGTVYDFEYVEFDGLTYPQWYASRETVTTVVFHESMKAVRPKDTGSWFHYFEKLKSIQHLDYLDTSEVEDMTAMFCRCSSLTSLDLSNFDTSKVIYMYAMFYKCTNLTSLDLSASAFTSM